MSNQYRATSGAAIAAYGADVLELDLSPTEEADLLGSGVLALVPRPYRVMVDNYSVNGEPVPEGAVIDAVFLVEIEAALLSGGVLERTRRDAHPTVEGVADPAAVLEADPAEAPKPKRKKAAPLAESPKE